MIEIVFNLFKPYLMPLLSGLIAEIFHKNSIDPDYVKKLNQASKEYSEATDAESKRVARLKLIDLAK